MKLCVLLAVLNWVLCWEAWGQTTEKDWQAQAIAEYPALGVRGSDLNTRFLAASAERRKIDPAFFHDPRWPLILAEALVAETSRSRAAAGGKVPVATPPATVTTAPNSPPPKAAMLKELPLPPTGQLMGLKRQVGAPFQIKSTAGKNYYVKLVDLSHSRLASVAIFVRGGDTVTVHVSLVKYLVKYAAGDRWYGSNSLFGPATTFTKVNTVLSFDKDSKEYNGYSMTLYPVPQGNLQTTPISRGEL
jgi:hypothetical protein